jgi:hypothetical protein
MTRSLLQAAAIVTLAVPVLIVGAWVYCMIAGIESADLSYAGKLCLGFILGALANRAWSTGA